MSRRAPTGATGIVVTKDGDAVIRLVINGPLANRVLALHDSGGMVGGIGETTRELVRLGLTVLDPTLSKEAEIIAACRQKALAEAREAVSNHFWQASLQLHALFESLHNDALAASNAARNQR